MKQCLLGHSGHTSAPQTLIPHTRDWLRCQSPARKGTTFVAFVSSPLQHFGVPRRIEELKSLPGSADLKLSNRERETEMAGNLKGWWRQRREELAVQQQRESSSTGSSFYIPSPYEGRDTPEVVNERIARAKHCTDEGVKAGFKAASVACVASAVPVLTAVRTIPWFKAHLNYTGQALIVSAATIATYFIVTDQTIHECSRKGSYDALQKKRSGALP